MFDEAKAKLGEVTKDEKKYSELLKNLVLQVRPRLDRYLSSPGSGGAHASQMNMRTSVDTCVAQALYTLMEKDITVSGRPKDQKLLQKAVEEAASEFRGKAGFEVQCEVDDKLGDKSCVLSPSKWFSFSKLTPNPRPQQARRSPLARVRVADHGQQHARRTVAVAAGADAARDPRVALWQE